MKLIYLTKTSLFFLIRCAEMLLWYFVFLTLLCYHVGHRVKVVFSVANEMINFYIGEKKSNFSCLKVLTYHDIRYKNKHNHFVNIKVTLWLTASPSLNITKPQSFLRLLQSRYSLKVQNLLGISHWHLLVTYVLILNPEWSIDLCLWLL